MLGRHSWPIRVDPGSETVFIGPIDGPAPETPADVLLDDAWQLVHPQVPDHPPVEGSD